MARVGGGFGTHGASVGTSLPTLNTAQRCGISIGPVWQGGYRLYVRLARMASDRTVVARTERNGAFHRDPLRSGAFHLQQKDTLRYGPILGGCRDSRHFIGMGSETTAIEILPVFLRHSPSDSKGVVMAVASAFSVDRTSSPSDRKKICSFRSSLLRLDLKNLASHISSVEDS